MSDIIELGTLRPYLGIKADDESHDTILSTLISSVSLMIENELAWPIIDAAYSDFEISGTGTSVLYLPAWPVTELSSVEEDGVELDEGEDKDFRLIAPRGILRKLAGVWSKGVLNIVVSMTAGYKLADVPADLQFAAMMKIAREWKKMRGQMWGEGARTFPDGSIQTDKMDSQFVDAELKILDLYRRPRL